MHIPTALLTTSLAALVAGGVARGETDRTVSPALFAELEEAARLADIAYCVGVSGIWKPFGCLSRCGDFPDFELVDTWNTGPLLSDSCGYIALDHPKKRIVVAFRGTYSIASALADLATTPQVYVPYPEDPPPPTSKPKRRGWWGWMPWFGGRGSTQQDILSAMAGPGDGGGRKQYIGGEGGNDKPTCKNCTVHLGFLTAWTHTRPSLLPHLARLATVVPDYEIHLLGHSLGGAIAALAGLELRARGVECVVTTFGEPRVGNKGLVGYLDEVFGVGEWQVKRGEERDGREGEGFRRVTHVGDPVPLLPLGEWGYAMHGGEIYVSKPSLPFEITDMERCVGDNDEKCIAGADGGVLDWKAVAAVATAEDTADGEGGEVGGEGGEDEVVRETWGLASRFRIWQLLFAHRDYFWRIGLCVPGGDPRGWGRGWYEKEREKGGRGDEL